MSVPPPYYPYPLPTEAPERAAPPRSATHSRRRRRRLRIPWVLVDDAFWTGVLTALSIAGLLAVIVATT